MESANSCLPWFALQIRGRYEGIVAAHLERRGYESFLPVYEARRRWSDRIKKMQLPLFPGYVFCRFDPSYRLPILTTPGVVLVVGIGKTPVPIDQAEITAIQAVVNSGLPRQPWPFLEKGQRVAIDYGPLSGLEGILVGFRGHHRIVLTVTLLQRSVAVEIDSAWVSPVSKPHPVPAIRVHPQPYGLRRI